MTIFRGPGGTGSANSDEDTTLYQDFLNQTIAAKDAALVAEANAEQAETNAELAEANAETAEANAISAAESAQEWATKTSGPVAGGEYSAKYNAQLAAASASSAEAALDAFDDRYLGAKASDPTVDNDGNPLITGTQYFNTVGNEIKVYNGTSWQSASVVGGTVTDLTVTNTINGSITGNAGTVTNGLYSTGSYSNPTWLTSLAWSKVTSTPTTIAGYGITDAYTKTEVDSALGGKLSNANGAVGTSNLATNSVTTTKIADAAVTTTKVASGTFGISISGNAATATNATNATNASNVPWTGVSGRPTAVSAFTNDAGYTTVAGANGAKAWVNFNGNGGSSIRASYNVSSVTRNATSVYTVNMTSSLADTNYAYMGFARQNADGTGGYSPIIVSYLSDTKTTSAFTIRVYGANNSNPQYYGESPEINIVAFR